jgi:hypothetical protein
MITGDKRALILESLAAGRARDGDPLNLVIARWMDEDEMRIKGPR